jgi:Kef-type K+ transport system membrane component KefB
MNYLVELLPLAVSVTLLLTAAHGVGQLFASLRQPRVIGEIVGGLLLGPTLLGIVSPEALAWLFPKAGATPAVLPILSQIGLVLLMYGSGSQLRTFVAPGEKKVVAALSLAGTLLPIVAGLAYLQFADSSDLLGTAQNQTAFVLVFATAIAIASIPVISRIMLDLGILETAFARIVIATAVIDDLLLYVVLAVALGMVSAGGASHGLVALVGLEAASPWAPLVHVLASLLLIGTTLLAGPWFWRIAVKFENRYLRWDNYAAVHVAFLVLVTAGCLYLGVNPMFGALASGMIAARVVQRHSVGASRVLQKLSLSFFVPLYFALVGARLDLIHHFDVVYFLEFLAFACVAKGVSIYIGARAAGEAHSAAVNLAAALNARGGPGIVLAAVSYEAGIINENFFAILVLVAIETSMAAGSWLGHVLRSGKPLRACAQEAERTKAGVPVQTT